MTKRETEFHELMLTGKSLKEIAKAMNITAGSAKIYSARVCQKSGVTTRPQLMAIEIKRLRALITPR